MVTGLITPVHGPTPTPPFRENMLFFSHPETTKSKLYGGGEWWWCMGGMFFFPHRKQHMFFVELAETYKDHMKYCRDWNAFRRYSKIQESCSDENFAKNMWVGLLQP